MRVNTVSPGPALTPWWTDAGGAADIIAGCDGHRPRQRGRDASRRSMMQLTTGRLVEPQEIADAVALLASPRSASTTGAELVVDAGMLKAL